jgi:toxin ParE1/3/4
MKPIRITPKADRDVDQCYQWMQNENPATACKFLEALDLTYTTVSRMPGIGSPRYANISLLTGLRMIKVKEFENYLIFYLEREAVVDIVRALHSSRNIPKTLQS